MPYKLKKVSKGYRVQNVSSKKYTSKKPMTLVNSKKQLKILNKKYK